MKRDAKPHSLFTPRHVSSITYIGQRGTGGVISKVDKPTEWCAGMVVVSKKGGDIRICVDLKPLTFFVKSIRRS